MTPGDIYQKAYELRVFQVWELVEELLKDWGFLGKKFVKDRVSSWLATQIRHGALVRVSSKPPVFAFPEFRDRWRSHIRYRTCEVCGKTFVPSMPHQKVCSKECKQKHYRNYHRQRRKNMNMKLDSKRRWTEKELKEALRLRKEGMTYRQIAELLGRTPEAVKDKLKRAEVGK